MEMDYENKNGSSRYPKKGWILCFPMVSQSKQFFERFILPENAYIFSIEPKRLSIDAVVDLLLDHLNNTA